MSARLPFSESQLVEEAAEFSQRITPAEARWRYCFDRCSYRHTDKFGDRSVRLNMRTVPVIAKVLGISRGMAEIRLGQIRRLGFEQALERGRQMDAVHDVANREFIKPAFWVGPMQAWHVGHVYFARVETHPHVLKIGFSRRVRDRLEDVAGKAKAKLACSAVRVGTLADEHWWHRELKVHRISGEWFFDPAMPARTLPDFLVGTMQEAA